jgi:membrane-associated phospholipid phosphatase
MAEMRAGRAALLWLLSGVVLVGFSILFVDRPVSTWSHALLRRPRLAVEITVLGGAAHTGIAAISVLAGAVVARLFGGKVAVGWRIAVQAALALLLAALAVTVLKYGFGRLWPETWIEHNPSWINGGQYGFRPFHGGEGYESFPSGHTARIAAPCAVLWQRLPRWRPVWVLLPVVMSAALVAADFHFVGDCIAGAYLAVACAAAILWMSRQKFFAS